MTSNLKSVSCDHLPAKIGGEFNLLDCLLPDQRKTLLLLSSSTTRSFVFQEPKDAREAVPFKSQIAEVMSFFSKFVGLLP